jgi:hypothetical protein
MDDLPEPDTPVNMVIWRLGMRKDTFFKLFSRAPRIWIYSWNTISLLLYVFKADCFSVGKSIKVDRPVWANTEVETLN